MITTRVEAKEKVSLALSELTIIPPFVRFDIVQLLYLYGKEPIKEKCEWIESNLLPLKPALYDSIMVKFIGGIEQNDRRYFSNHSTLLDYIRCRLLPICDSFRGYKFDISF